MQKNNEDHSAFLGVKERNKWKKKKKKGSLTINQPYFDYLRHRLWKIRHRGIK
jgi:hypothetical protein